MAHRDRGISGGRPLASTKRIVEMSRHLLDLLVDAEPRETLLDLGGLQMDLTELLQIPVHLFTAKDISPRFREDVLAEVDPIFK